MTEENRANPLLIATVAGIAGATAALLFAPRSGRETRRMIRDTTEEAKEHVKSSAQRGLDKARAVKEGVSEAVKSTAQVARDEADQIMSRQEEE